MWRRPNGSAKSSDRRQIGTSRGYQRQSNDVGARLIAIPWEGLTGLPRLVEGRTWNNALRRPAMRDVQ